MGFLFDGCSKDALWPTRFYRRSTVLSTKTAVSRPALLAPPETGGALTCRAPKCYNAAGYGGNWLGIWQDLAPAHRL
jgi:hypothetical protein